MSQRRRPPPDDKRGVADTASSSSLRSGLAEVEVAFELAEERVLDDSLDAASFFLAAIFAGGCQVDAGQ